MLKLLQKSPTQLTPEQAHAKSLIKPGVTLYGFCCGFFGRDSYDDKVVIDIFSDGKSIYVEEDGATHSSVELEGDDWIKLVESSNRVASGESEC